MKKLFILLWACLSSTIMLANHWTPENSGNYSLVMGVTGIVQINGEEQFSDQLELGAFCGTECRGSQMAMLFPLTNQYLVMISIYGEVGHEITFKLFDHSTGQEVNAPTPATLTFTNDGYGTPIEPYVLNFIAEVNCTISASANPTNGGTVSGGGTYAHGATCTLAATPATGYSFTNWTKNGTIVSTDATYSFTVNESASYVANFVQQGQITLHWTPVDQALYSNSSTIIGVVMIDGVEQFSSTIELGIFCGDECRGTNLAEDFFITHRFLYFVNVYGENGNVLNFRLYDHSIGQELSLTPPASVVFTDEGYGNPIEPYELNFTSTVEVSALVDPETAGTVAGTGEYAIGSTCTLTATANPGFQFKNWTLDEAVVSTSPSYVFTVTEDVAYVAHFSYVQTSALLSGWNWWSTYIEQSGINGLQMLENSLGTSGIRIQGKNACVDYFEYQGTGYWYGALNAITNEQMYKIRTSAACNAEIVGDLVVSNNHPITLNSGWSWIGFSSYQSLDVNEALSNITPEPNDIIKGRNGSATYISYGNYHLWYGQLSTLEPGLGYMYKSNSNTPKTLVFPTNRGNEEGTPNVIPEDNVYIPADAEYADNMLITAVIELAGEELRSEEYELAAFVGDECRGSVKLMYIEPLDRYVAFLLAFGDIEENLHFLLTDGTDVSLSDDLVKYEIDGTVGTPIEPVTLHFGTTSVATDMMVPIQVYPNPSEGVFNVEGAGIRKIEVMNAYGQVILFEEAMNGTLQVNLRDSAAGAYLMRIVTNNGVITKKLIKKS